MGILRAFCLVVGILGLLMGLLWIGQGLGIIMWPLSSFMLANRFWAGAGAVLAVVSAAVIWLSRPR